MVGFKLGASQGEAAFLVPARHLFGFVVHVEDRGCLVEGYRAGWSSLAEE